MIETSRRETIMTALSPHLRQATPVLAASGEGVHLYGEDGRTLLAPEQLPLARAFAGQIVQGQQVVVRSPGRHPRRFVANARPIDDVDDRRADRIHSAIDATEDRARHECREGDWRAVANISNRYDRIAGWIRAEGNDGWRGRW